MSSNRDKPVQALALGFTVLLPILLIAAFLATARAMFGNAPESATRVIAAPAPAAIGNSAAPTPAKAVGATMSRSSGYSDDEGGSDFFWALVEARGSRGRETIGTTDEQAARAISRALREQSGVFLYVRVDGLDYILRDPKTIARATELVQPMQALGRKMGELGGRQGVLGRQQGTLGREQGRLGARQAMLGARQASVSLKIHGRERRGLSTADLEREQGRIHAEMEQYSRRQNELGERQTKLGGLQSALAEEQSRYGEAMSRVSRDVERAIRTLAREAIESGQAQVLAENEA